MQQAHMAKAYGKVFDPPGVINVWPTGNVGVKRETDPDIFCALTVSPENAQPLM